MNKETFLGELREYLRILEDQEQEDILAEYAQHIDMKMQKGLSEEEAIWDFGPMKELAAEILEAYHVKPEFSKENRAIRLPGLKKGEPGDKRLSLRDMGRFLKEKLLLLVHNIGHGFSWLGGKCRVLAGRLAKPFKRKRSRIEDAAWTGKLLGEDTEAMGKGTGDMGKGTEDMGKHAGRFLRAIGYGIVASWRWFLRFCGWWLRLLWNMGWLMLSLFCAALCMILLMGVGAMLILLLQGYPLIGLFLISLGAILCLGSLSYGAFSLLIRKEKEKDKDGIQKKDGEHPTGEVQYE